MTDGNRAGMLLAALDRQGSTMLGKDGGERAADLLPLLVGQALFADDGTVLALLDIETRKLLTVEANKASRAPRSIRFAPQGKTTWPVEVFYQDDGASRRPETWRPMSKGAPVKPTVKVRGSKTERKTVPITPAWLDEMWRQAERARVNKTKMALERQIAAADPDGVWKLATGNLPECQGVYGITVRYVRQMTQAEIAKRDAGAVEADKPADVVALVNAPAGDGSTRKRQGPRNRNRKPTGDKPTGEQQQTA